MEAVAQRGFRGALFRVNAPTHLRPARVAPRAEGVISFIQWAEAQHRETPSTPTGQSETT
jgi:hypothetical protein